jgi:hypothetical protein
VRTTEALWRSATSFWFTLQRGLLDQIYSGALLNTPKQIKAGTFKSVQRLLRCELDVLSSISRQRFLFFDTSSRPSGYRDPCSWGRSDLGMQLTIHLHLKPMFRMRGVITSLLHTSPWCGAWTLSCPASCTW